MMTSQERVFKIRSYFGYHTNAFADRDSLKLNN